MGDGDGTRLDKEARSTEDSGITRISPDAPVPPRHPRTARHLPHPRLAQTDSRRPLPRPFLARKRTRIQTARSQTAASRPRRPTRVSKLAWACRLRTLHLCDTL